MQPILDDELTGGKELDLIVLKKYQVRQKIYAFVYVLLSVFLGVLMGDGRSNILVRFLDAIPLLKNWLLSYFAICFIMVFIYFKLSFTSIWLSLILGAIGFVLTLLILTIVVNIFSLSPDFLPALALFGSLLIVTISLYIPQKHQIAYVKASTR